MTAWRIGFRVRMDEDCFGWTRDNSATIRVPKGATGTVQGHALITGMWQVELDDGKGYTAASPRFATMIGDSLAGV